MLNAVDRDLDRLVTSVAKKLLAAGQISSLYEKEPHQRRLWLIEQERPQSIVIFLRNGILPLAISRLWGSDVLVSAAQQLLGGASVCANPIWNIRPKTPGSEENVVPWHQDNAYLFEQTRGVHVPTAWIPLESATK